MWTAAAAAGEMKLAALVYSLKSPNVLELDGKRGKRRYDHQCQYVFLARVWSGWVLAQQLEHVQKLETRAKRKEGEGERVEQTFMQSEADPS